MNKKWTGKTRGGYWGNYIFLTLLKFGLFPAYALLPFVAIFFLIFRRHLLISSQSYLERVLKRKVSLISFTTYKLILNFGISMLDRATFFSGSKSVNLDSSQSDKLIAQALKNNHGVIVLTAHVGGWQMSAMSLSNFGIPVSVIGEENEDEKLKTLFQKNQKFTPPSIIPNDSESFIDAYTTLKRGEILAMHADRFISGRAETAKFLGKDARFPAFAYGLAKKTGAQIIQVLCVRKSLKNYETIAFDLSQEENETTQQKTPAQLFAKNLEETVKKYPYQWYNFFDFWTQ